MPCINRLDLPTSAGAPTKFFPQSEAALVQSTRTKPSSSSQRLQRTLLSQNTAGGAIYPAGPLYRTPPCENSPFLLEQRDELRRRRIRLSQHLDACLL